MTNMMSKIIEEMGFTKIDDNYTAKFVSKFTNNIIDVVVDDLTDDPDDLEPVRFHAYNEAGELLSSQTLAQMIVACERELIIVKNEWEDEYRVYFDVGIEVPVKLNELDEMSRKMLLVDLVTDKNKLITGLAHDTLVEEIRASKLGIVTSKFNRIEKLIRN